MKDKINDSKIIRRYKNIYDYQGNKHFYQTIAKQFKNISEDKFILKHGFNTDGEYTSEEKYWKDQMKEWEDIL